MRALLTRILLKDLTPGILILENGWACRTLERPWLNNAPSISCIPTGTYRVVRHLSPSKGDCFLVSNTFPRTNILIHVLNTVLETEGCIGIGLRYEDRRLFESRLALRDLKLQAPDGFDLTITEF